MISFKKQTMLLGLAIGLFFSACDGENSTKIEEEKRDIIGNFIDSAVEGVEYRCGEVIDFTDENGTFLCTTLPVSFYIGSIRLGELNTLPLDKQVFPQDIIDVNRSNVNDSEVIKLALLLQSLDEDNNATNGIHISNRVRNLFDEEIVLSEVTVEELKNTVQNKDANITFKDIEEVIHHLSFSVGIITDETNATVDNNDGNGNSETNATVDNNDGNGNSETNATVDNNDGNGNSETNATVDNNDGNGNSETNATVDNNDGNGNSETNATVDNNDGNGNSETNATVDNNDGNGNSETNATVDNNDGNGNSETNATVDNNDGNGNSETNATVDNNDGNGNSEANTTVVIDNNNSEANTTVVIDNNNSEANTTVVIDNNNSEANTTDNNTTENNNTAVLDTTAPNAPTLITTPRFTNQDNITVQVNGEANAILFINDFSSGSLNAQGVLSVALNTSGIDGEKDFNLTLKDSSSNESPQLNIKIIKDSIPPAQNSTIDSITTDDTTPPLSGNLPSGENDTNTTNYKISVKIDNEEYRASNNQNGKWSIDDDTLDTLEIGKYDVNITVTDEANNSSSTFISNKIEIDNTGFLIDSALEGIKYISGAYSGYTDKDGLFKYDKGAGVTFYIGDESTGISLGTATEKVDPFNSQRRIITLFDLAGSQDENSVRVINMGKLLQSLDSDNDVSNGITIDERTKESIALLGLKNRIDFDLDIETFHNHNDIYELFNDLAGHFGEHRGLLDTKDVQAHLVSIRDNTLVTKSYKIEKTSGEKEVTRVLNGLFQSVGGVVEGLEYRSGNQFGRTDSSGTFTYEEGKTVKFYIYQLELGTTQAKAVVTPADLVPATSFNHPKPRNIIRLLNAFDAPNSSNILIDNAVREALEKYRSQIDINLPDGKANAELNIPQGVDEFGAQFEDFEMGKDILDEIDTIRGSL